MAPDLGLHLKLSASKVVSSFSREASSVEGDDRRIAKLKQYISNLEEERRKIDVFKRELPLSMFLLNDVIEGMRAELDQCRRCEKPRVLEDFMPIKSKSVDEPGAKSEKSNKDKMNWMSSVQLWNDNYSGAGGNDGDDNSSAKNSNKSEAREAGNESDHGQDSDTPSLESKSKIFGRAFVPFKQLPKKDGEATADLPDLSLVARPVMVLPAAVSNANPTARCQVSSPARSHVSLHSQQQAPRKARRCWSPELHRRFVVALQQLGGAHVATPKQIRELMRVDGLTNDEVKSHLQKFRLHTRKAPNSSPWEVQESYGTSQQSTLQSGSPQGPLQLTGSSRAVSVTAGESGDEDGKSESCSWK